jgi:hypothetical protein
LRGCVLASACCFMLVAAIQSLCRVPNCLYPSMLEKKLTISCTTLAQIDFVLGERCRWP